MFRERWIYPDHSIWVHILSKSVNVSWGLDIQLRVSHDYACHLLQNFESVLHPGDYLQLFMEATAKSPLRKKKCS